MPSFLRSVYIYNRGILNTDLSQSKHISNMFLLSTTNHNYSRLEYMPLSKVDMCPPPCFQLLFICNMTIDLTVMATCRRHNYVLRVARQVRPQVNYKCCPLPGNTFWIYFCMSCI